MLKPRTIDAAVGKWDGILVGLGVDAKFLSRKHGPCPFCSGKDRFRFDDKDGSGSFICSKCGAGNGLTFLMLAFGWSFREAAANVDGIVGNVIAEKIQEERTEEEKLSVIKRVLSECRKVEKGDPVWKYLNRRTGIETVPGDIKYHPYMKHTSGGKFNAMVSVMRDVNGLGVTLHRTYLTCDGNKANVDPVKKFMAGKKLNGSSVRLSPIQEHVGIAEGIENALSASVQFFMPVWAATNAVLLEQWMPPEGVKKVSIFGDSDSSFTGQAAAYSLAKRLANKGLSVTVVMPDEIDKDWCDAR